MFAGSTEDPSSEDERSFSDKSSRKTEDTEAYEENEASGIRETLIKREEKAVRTARVFVIIVILVMAIGVSLAVYFASARDVYTFDVAVSSHVP
jgi:hypothetical protein